MSGKEDKTRDKEEKPKPQSTNSNNSEKTNNNNQGSSWWGWVDTFKKASNKIVEACKEDLKEFGSTIKRDAQEVINQNNANNITQKVSTLTTSLTNVWDTLQNSFTTTDKEAQSQRNLRLEQLRSNPETYNTKPEDPEFLEWQKTFDFDSKSQLYSQILADNQQVFELHQKLVPSELSPKDFWERYFYRLEKLNQEEKRREELVKLAESQRSGEEEIGWDFDEDEAGESSEHKEVVPEKPLIEKDQPVPEGAAQTIQTTVTLVEPPKQEHTEIKQEEPPVQQPITVQDTKNEEQSKVPKESEATEKEEPITPTPEISESKSNTKPHGGDDDVFGWQ